MKTIIISGANGYVGKSLCRNLASSYQVIGLVRNKVTKIKNVEIMEYENLQKINFLFEDIIFIHSAAFVHKNPKMDKSQIKNIYETNVKFTKNFFKKAIEFKANKFIFISTVAVYGENNLLKKSLNELSPTNPQTIYARTKLLAEKILIDNFKDTECNLIILRPALIYGKDAPGNIRLLDNLIKKGYPIIFGSCDNKRSYLSINYFNYCIKKIIDKNFEKSKLYVLADDDPVETSVLTNEIYKLRNKNNLIIKIPKIIFKLLMFITPLKRFLDKIIFDFIIDPSVIKKDLNIIRKSSTKKELNKVMSA